MARNAIEEVANFEIDKDDFPLTFDIIADRQAKCKNLREIKTYCNLSIRISISTLHFYNMSSCGSMMPLSILILITTTR